MSKGKKFTRMKGLTVHFKQLKQGEMVTVVFNPSIPFHFPKRIIGYTGIVTGKKGRANIIELREGGKSKTFLIGAAHLKKIRA